ncbi:PH domain-containing protein [Streptomyces sp. WM6386]|uniref:PH domain-containing protein n=1 Tax=Streptomyces sp. WM6386 TaxID=1415558 RepID=UPI0006198433|nr:PH domain-containing protein [Streptomyces sp. WM6386]KKD07303.1 hypothetical protein TN53_13640 [Streptomyces sp. WM6386]
MGGDIIREYRRQGSAWKPLGAVGLLFAAGVGEVLLNGVPLWPAVALVTVLLLSNGWMALALLRPRTVVRPGGITSYSALRVRKWTWHDIRDLRVENAPQASSLRFVTCLHDTAGRRTVLPFVNDRCVPDLPTEAEFLRGVLASGRGVA